jgi:hypothetical protein
MIAHADWSCDPCKRQVAVASLVSASVGAGPRYRVVSLAAAPRGNEPDIFGLLPAAQLPGAALLGFDFIIGLPKAYAAAAEVNSFPVFLAALGSPPWEDFEHIAEWPAEIGVRRPFYPKRPGGTTREHLYAGLGLSAQALRRRCEGSDAEILFWTLGPKQTGKASLHGWRLLRQARATTTGIALWPFEGSLTALLAGANRVVVAEAYPREFYRYIGVSSRAGWSKRRRNDRLQCVPALLEWADSLSVGWDADILRRVRSGLSEGTAGEDEFDAIVGLIGLIGVATGRISDGLPADDCAVATTEGWILGRAG